MKYLMMVAVVLSMMAADAKLANGPTLSKEEFKEMIYRKTGGKIKQPNVQKGVLVYVNAQTKVPVEWIQANADEFAENVQIEIRVEEGQFELPNPQVAGDASLFIVDDEKLPSLLVAPEQKWAMVNVAPLTSGRGAKEAFLKARVQKELTRGFCMLAGATASNYPNSITGCITKPEQLDRFVNTQLPVDIPERFKEYLKGYGIVPYNLVTYKTACQEGWAPEPTNEVQQVIWEKIKAEQSEKPSNPLTIKPGDKPKGK